jgi:nuclear GTP-binding protein
VKEHKRKERKEARKHPHLKKKKDPGIPNSMPFKAEILAEIEYVKKRAVEQKDAQKEKRRLELVSSWPCCCCAYPFVNCKWGQL